ncbi:MAG: hypothetical protein ACO4AY_13720, partial [Ilumatobacteraceae bacterium]
MPFGDLVEVQPPVGVEEIIEVVDRIGPDARHDECSDGRLVDGVGVVPGDRPRHGLGDHLDGADDVVRVDGAVAAARHQILTLAR